METNIGRVSAMVAIRSSVEQAMRREFGGEWESGEYEPREVASADRLESERYARRDWVWRR